MKRSQKSSILNASSVEPILHPKHSITMTQVCTNCLGIQQPQNSGRQETWSKLRTADENILGAKIHSSVATIRAPLFQDLLPGLCSNSRWGIQHVLSPDIVKLPQNRSRRPRVGVEVQLDPFLSLGARWGGWSKPRPGRSTPGKDPVPIE